MSGDVMHPKALDLYVKAKTAHEDIYVALKAVNDEVEKTLDIADLAHFILSMKKTLAFVESLLQEARARIGSAERKTCAIWVAKADPEPIRTSYGTFSPNVRMTAALPKRQHNPEGYAALMRYFNIPDDLWDKPEDERPVVQLHWQGMVDHISELMMQGKPLPPGVSTTKTYPVYAVKCMPSREVDSQG